MDIREHFSKREIERLNKLPKTVKIYRWILILFAIFSVVISIVNFRLAVIMGQRHGIDGLMNVLSIAYKNVEVGKTYQWYEVAIAQRLASAHLDLLLVITCLLILSFGWKDRCLLKCWKLLSSESRNNRT